MRGEIFRPFFGRPDFILDFVPLGPVRPVFPEQFAVPCKVVKHLGVGTRVAQQELFALAVHLDKFFAQTLQVGECDNRSVYAGAALAVLLDFAADNEFVVAVQLQFFENAFHLRFVRNVESGFDDRLFFAGADHRCLGLVAAYDAEGLKKNRFSCAGLAGNRRKTFAEGDFRLRNQSKSTNRQVL